MILDIKRKVTSSIDLGDVLVSETGSMFMLVENSSYVEFPIGILSLKTLKMVNSYKSLKSIEDSIIAGRSSIAMGMGKVVEVIKSNELKISRVGD